LRSSDSCTADSAHDRVRGLPAHPLFVHVPVVLVPCTVIAALVFMARTDWFSRYAIALSLVRSSR